MRFPLADWIDAHPDCRHNLGKSGMRGTVELPRPTAREVRSADAPELEGAIGHLLGVDHRRVFLTHGASEGNGLVLTYLAHRGRPGTQRYRARRPEYPPLTDVARAVSLRPATGRGRAEIAIASDPRNPEGTAWSPDELERLVEGTRAVLLDETFREFTARASHAREGRPGRWTTGTFTKFYGADDIRVGFVVAPPEARTDYARFHGLLTDEVAPFSIASALRILADHAAIARRVRGLFERNRGALAAWRPEASALTAPVYFDRALDGDVLARRCLRRSVLVCPGRYFGARAGVRICLTRRTFPADLAAYRRVVEEGGRRP